LRVEGLNALAQHLEAPDRTPRVCEAVVDVFELQTKPAPEKAALAQGLGVGGWGLGVGRVSGTRRQRAKPHDDRRVGDISLHA
jgi:hypothetical protein